MQWIEVELVAGLRRHGLRWLRTCLVWMLLSLACFTRSAGADERPNILWITCEDISPYLGCYGCKEALTPNLDALAGQGTRYTRAYANAPVCAVARSTLLTGMYSATLGTHQMRSNVRLPASIPAYPRIFREAGYYCSNNSKKDYNSNFSSDKELWNESSRTAHWRNREDGQPFFAVFNITVTHEGQLGPKSIAKYVGRKQIPEKSRIDPADIELPPYHPDLPVIRGEWARLHDLITLMDEMVGGRLKEIEEAGLAEDTIVFFYSDHGGQLARSKRYIYDVGTRVPLIVRMPEKWRHLAPTQPGGVVDRLVSFIDFPKTALSLAGLTVPEAMQGRVFLGPGSESAPEFVHFYRDRMAERYDFSRAVSDGRYYFIRNFMPHRPRGRDSRYGPTVQENWVAWEEHFDAGNCDPVQSQFFLPKSPVELFDTQGDPWQVKSIAGRPEHQERLLAMERELDQWMIASRDLGMVPEPLFHDLAGPGKKFRTLHEFGRSDDFAVERVLAAAKTASRGDPAKVRGYLEMMDDGNPIIRHWGAYGIFLARPDDPGVRRVLKTMAGGDAMAGNRVMAAQALALCGDPDAAFDRIMKEANETADGYVLLSALNALQYSHTDKRLTREDWQALRKKGASKQAGVDEMGFGYARRIIDDALKIWPKRRRVD